MYFDQNMIDTIRGREPENTSLQIMSVAFAGGSSLWGAPIAER